MSAEYLLSRIEVSADREFAKMLFRGDASSARELHVVTSGTMITVPALVFVLTVIALQIGVHSVLPSTVALVPDPGTRLVLGMFVATFA